MEEKYTKIPWGKAIPYTSPTGRKTFLYSIGTAAQSIARSPQTLRKWEVGGIIPLTPFKMHGNRMYSTEHIDALVECAEKSHIRPGTRIQDTAFSSNMYKRYQEIYDLFFTKSNEESEVSSDGIKEEQQSKEGNSKQEAGRKKPRLRRAKNDK